MLNHCPLTKDAHGKMVAEGILRASVVLGQNVWGRPLFCWIIGRDAKNVKRRLIPNSPIDCEPQYSRDAQHIPAQIAAFMAPPNYVVGVHLDVVFASLGFTAPSIQCFDLSLSRVLDAYQCSGKTDMVYVSPMHPQLRLPELVKIFSHNRCNIRVHDGISFRSLFLDGCAMGILF